MSVRAVVLSALGALLAQTPVTQLDLDKIGPKVGTRAADFQLVDQQGQTRALKSVAGPKGTMLVFFRSAEW